MKDYKKYLEYQDDAQEIIFELSKLIKNRQPNDKKIVGLVNELKHVMTKRVQLTAKHKETNEKIIK